MAIADPAVTVGIDLTIPVVGLSEGPHTVAVTATDSLGNTSAPTNVAVTVDASPPSLAGSSSSSASPPMRCIRSAAS